MIIEDFVVKAHIDRTEVEEVKRHLDCLEEQLHQIAAVMDSLTVHINKLSEEGLNVWVKSEADDELHG